MMFRKSLFVFFIVALSHVNAARVTTVTASNRLQQTAGSSAPQSQRQTVAPAGNGPSASPQVREVDAEGLKKLLRLDASAPKQPLLVNFWATWCVPCREEFPDLVKINDEFAPRGLNFITVSLDDPAEIDKTVPQFLREMRATKMPAYLLNTPEPETAINAVDPTWSGGLPATFLFDRERRVVFKHIGRINPAELRAAIEGAMK